MNISNQYPVMIFRNERDGKVSYSVGLSRKNQDGEYESAYFPVRFKKGVEVENKTKIYLNTAFLTFSTYENEDGKTKSFVYIMVTDFTVEGEHKGNESFRSDEIELSEDDFPF